ncbi:MAG: CapA family protein [Calditrichaeota bacterium]|nr:CapA family protein [Calditrichota bacterium]
MIRLVIFTVFLALCLTPLRLPGGETDITLLFTGDVTFANHFLNHVKKKYDFPFALIPWFKQADISVINLEDPLTNATEPAEKPYVFKAPPYYIEILKRGGVDLVSLANNHIYDYGEAGLLETIELLEHAGIKYIGAGRNIKQARKPAVFDISGVKFGFLAYYGLKAHSESHPATETQAGTALRKLKYIREDVKKLRKKVDFVTVVFHWGLEKENYPQDDQIRFAHRVIDYGADLIVGHHPHVLQGVEKYKQGIIVYSLGNFIFGGHSRTYYQTVVLKVNVPPEHPDRWNIEFIPIEVNHWQPRVANSAEADSILNRIKKYSDVFEHTPFD